MTSETKKKVLGFKVDYETFSAVEQYCEVNSISKQRLLEDICTIRLNQIKQVNSSKEGLR